MEYRQLLSLFLCEAFWGYWCRSILNPKSRLTASSESVHRAVGGIIGSVGAVYSGYVRNVVGCEDRAVFCRCEG